LARWVSLLLSLYSAFSPVDGNGAGDTFINLAPGQRMFQGDMIYRTFSSFCPRAPPLVNFFMFQAFRLRLWIRRSVGGAFRIRAGMALVS